LSYSQETQEKATYRAQLQQKLDRKLAQADGSLSLVYFLVFIVYAPFTVRQRQLEADLEQMIAADEREMMSTKEKAFRESALSLFFHLPPSLSVSLSLPIFLFLLFADWTTNLRK
jgi:hypothetical protein